MQPYFYFSFFHSNPIEKAIYSVKRYFQGTGATISIITLIMEEEIYKGYSAHRNLLLPLENMNVSNATCQLAGRVIYYSTQ